MRFLLGAVVLVPAIAAADAPTRDLKASGTASNYDFVATPGTSDELVFARQVLPPASPAIDGNGSAPLVAQSKIIYLNHNGVTLRPGTNDSRTQTSSIANQQVVIPAWTTSAQTWSDTVTCMQGLYSRFAVTVTDVDPGSAQHIEAVFGGSPGIVGLPSNVAGVSPFTLDCSIIENSIVFAFTDVLPGDARSACEVMAQEVAHSFGLDHELLASDPMTYLPYQGPRAFQDQAASCGEYQSRVCGINGSTCRADQNSVALLGARLGLNNGDLQAPTLGISSPSEGATVPPGFSVTATATDNVGVTMATLSIDGAASGSLTAAPYTFKTPGTLSEGAHVLRIEATDGTNLQTQSLNVIVKIGAPLPGGGNSSDDDSNDISGGCAAGGSGSGASLALGLIGLVTLIRRRR